MRVPGLFGVERKVGEAVAFDIVGKVTDVAGYTGR